MSIKPYLIPAAILAASPSLLASIYISDFSAATPGDALLGVDSFQQSEVNSDVAFVGTIASPVSSNGTNAGAVGVLFGEPAGSSFYANRNIGAPLAGPASSPSLKIVFSIVDSVTSTGFTNRNNFAFTLANGDGPGATNLFTVNFTPQNATPADPTAEVNGLWDISITSAGITIPAPAFRAVAEDAAYILDLTFFSSGADIGYAASVFDNLGGAPSTETGTLVGLNGETIDEIRFGFDDGGVAFGSNFILFQAVPEPTSFLLVALSGLGLLRRRR